MSTISTVTTMTGPGTGFADPETRGLALVACERVIRDADTGQPSLIGVFNAMASGAFPCRIPQLCVYVAAARGSRPDVRMALVVSSPAGEEVARSALDASGSEPLGTYENTVTFRNLTFGSPGRYTVRLLCDDRVALERPLVVNAVRG